MPSGFIDDGFNRPGYIAAGKSPVGDEPLYDALEFEYRQAMRSENIALDAKVRAASRDKDTPENAVKVESLACEFVKSHLLSWSLKNRGGHIVEITVPNLMNVHQQLFNRIYTIIRGEASSDINPNSTTPAPTDEEQLKNSERASGLDLGTLQ